VSPARAELLRSGSRSCCTDVDVASGGLITAAGHGEFRSETVSSESRRGSRLNLALSSQLVDINQTSGKPVSRTKHNCV
jgi:hypothetical protein